MFLVQNSIDSIDRIGEATAGRSIDTYFKYAKNDDRIGVNTLKSEMDQNVLSTTDMFARGKVSIIFGYPTLLREIEYSLKRASSEAELKERDLRSAPIPQKQSGTKVNLARYNYFAVSKYAKESNAAADFVGYLTTKSAGDLYSASFSQYLPARNDVLETLKTEKRVMNKTFPWVQYDSFLPSQDITLVNFDRGLTSEFEQSLGQALDRADQNSQAILETAQKQVACRKKQLLDRTGFDISCEN